MKFIFWNIHKQPLVEEIAELIAEKQCDICAFAETDEETINQAVELLRDKYQIDCSLYLNPGCDRITIIVVGELKISLLNQQRYFSLVKIKGKNKELIAGFVHFPSQLNCTLDALGDIFARFRSQLVIEEVRCHIQDSMVIGDFNVNPFERPMISFRSMGATNGQDCSLRRSIKSYEVSNQLFYNPMWTLYAAHKERPGGHKYLNTPNHVLTWHFLDQVIIRPSLIEYFNFESLLVIKRTKNFNYLNNNQVPKVSGHLPLMCEIAI